MTNRRCAGLVTGGFALLTPLGAFQTSVDQVEPLLRVGVPIPPLLDLRDARVVELVPADPRNPAHVEAARSAWGSLIEPFRGLPALRLRLPRGTGRLALLLAASQALKAQDSRQRLYLDFDGQAAPLMEEAAWGAVDGGSLGPEGLGTDPAQWRGILSLAQGFFPGRSWTLWTPADPGALLGALLGDGGRLVVPAGGPAEALSQTLPLNFTEVEGGMGDLIFRNKAGEASRWRLVDGAWRARELPRTRTEVQVTTTADYDIQALLARMRAAQARDRSALRTFEADMAVDLHVQPGRGPGVDVGFRFRMFEALGDSEEMLQRQILFNGVKAKLPDGVQLPLVESRTSLAPPVALSLTERYRYSDRGPGGPGQRWIHFEPLEPDPTLLRGDLRVDEASGRILEEQSEREGLPGTVKSERRVLTYGAAGSGWRALKVQTFERWLFPGGVSQVQRTLSYSNPSVNADGFEARRAEARLGTATMFKQTPEGYRYFVREADGTRRIEDKPRTGGRAAGLALLVDPGLGLPVLPLGGLAFFDYNAFGKGVQINAFTAGVFNSVALAVPRLPGGFDLNLNSVVMLLSSDEKPVKNGRLLDEDAVGRKFATVALEVGRDLSRGVRAEVQGHFQYDRFGLARDGRTEGFVLPPSGWTREFRGELSWLWRGVQARSFFTKGTRPDGVFGAPGALQPIANSGSFRRWGGSLGMDRQLSSGLWFHAQGSTVTGSGMDRFNAIEVGGLSGSVAGIRSHALAADRLTSARVNLTLPSGPNLRLSVGLEHAVARSLDDGRDYRFTGASASGDMPGFGWFTACRVNLGVGLKSDVPGVKAVNGMFTFLRVF